MRWLYRLGLVLGALFVLAVFVGLALPQDYRVERSVETSATIAQVHELVANLNAWPAWGATHAGVEIVDEDPALGIAYEIRDEKGYLLRWGAIRYEETDEKLLVTWLAAGELGSSPLERYRGLARARDEGAALETSLARLAGLAESQSSAP